MNKFFYSFHLASILMLFCLHPASAQSPTQIMDARIDWTPTGSQYSGQISLYLTDTVDLSGIRIKMGSQPDDSDLYQVSYPISNGSFSGGTLHNNVLQAGIGDFPYHADYYARISILLSNGQRKEIAIHSSN